MADIIQTRRDTAANWTSENPTLANGEIGYETDTGKMKFGDGSTAWTSLSYFIADFSNDTSPQLGGDLEFNGYCMEFKPSPSSDLSFSGFYTTLTVDTNSIGITAALCMASDGNLDEADASATGTMPVFGLAMETGTGSKKVFQLGYVRNDAWDWTPKGLIYASATSGGLTQTAVSTSGDQLQIVGIATHADRIFFNPSYVMAEID